MDVTELAPALLAFGQLIRDSNRFLNGDQSTVEVKVDAQFRRGSFDFQLLLDQHIWETVDRTLEFASVVDLNSILHALFGVAKDHPDKVIEGAFAGLFRIYKLLSGKKPDKNTITIQDNHGVINLGDQKIEVDAKGAQLYSNDTIRADMDHVASSVAKDGIERLEVSKDERVLDGLDKSDLPRHIRLLGAPQEETEHVLTDSREALVKVVTANFEEGKWRFSDGSAKFSATIADPVFQQKLDDRQEGFYKGDVLRVVLRTEQMEKTDGKIQTLHTIEEVLEHRQTGIQQRLLPPRGKQR